MDNLTGRKVIYTDAEIVDASNVAEELDKAVKIHFKNSNEIEYLFNVYKGKQDILQRVKTIRPEINNKVVVNIANEIVAFKTGYAMSDPIQYVCRDGASEYFELINSLNAYMLSEGKEQKDKELADWFHICGTAYRLILADGEANEEEDEAPFEIFTLDPRYTFVVYSSGVNHKRLMGVTYVKREDNKIIYSVYTDNAYFEVSDGKIIRSEAHSLGVVPIIEYPANLARLGAFENVLPLLNAINLVISNRLDGVEQFIQALLMFKNVEIDTDEYKQLIESGGIKVPPDGDVKYLIQELNQTQTQVLVDDLYNRVLTICGMPNRNGGSSTSDTGSAVIMRDGWYEAEARAKNTELVFERSEREFLKLAIYITNTLRGKELKLSNIKIKFTRRNYEHILEKTQVFSTLMATGETHPKYAFEISGLFNEPDLACKESMEWADQRQSKMVERLMREGKANDENAKEEQTGRTEHTETV